MSSDPDKSFSGSVSGSEYSGINRLTNNIDLALPIIDDAFRYILLTLNS